MGSLEKKNANTQALNIQKVKNKISPDRQEES